MTTVVAEAGISRRGDTPQGGGKRADAPFEVQQDKLVIG